MKGKDLKPHIGIFGRRNNGKSSFINSLVGQEIAIVSSVPGTTTDPVKKSVEIFGVGPAIVIDTAGIDDVGEIGKKRIEKTREVIEWVDMAILLIANNVFGQFEMLLVDEFNKNSIPYFIIHNKSDSEKLNISTKERLFSLGVEIMEYSSLMSENKPELHELIKRTMPGKVFQKRSLLEGLVEPNDIVLLVTPIDSEAPESRMILPQQMAIRDVLDKNCVNIVLKETELEMFLRRSGIKPKLVITDSQVFTMVEKIIPEEIQLTSFSILFARLKGNFDYFVKGTPFLSQLNDGDKILILESCSHQISCEDIGRIKIPKWLNEYSKKKLSYKVVSGLDNIENIIHDYNMVIQCGGCVSTEKQITVRVKKAMDAGIPVTNYGMAIAYMNGIFDRVIQPFRK